MSSAPVGGTTSKVAGPSRAEREAEASMEVLRPMMRTVEGSVMATL